MIRHGQALPLTPVPPTACAVYFGASYHADYATLLAHPADMPRAAEALATAFANEAVTPPPSAADPNHPEPWTVVDLRRLRLADPATDALATAFGRHEMAEGWTLNVEREDVCPVIRIPEGADIDGVLATLGKKERHEIRRKVRRAEAAGAIELVESTDPLADLDAFIDLHQARWGERGLFPPTPGGDQSRRFIRRLFELYPGRRRQWTIHLGFLTVGGPTDRRRDPLRDRRVRSCTTTPAWTRTRATSRPASCSWSASSGARSSAASAGLICCAATSRTSTSGAPSTSRSSGSSCAAPACRHDRTHSPHPIPPLALGIDPCFEPVDPPAAARQSRSASASSSCSRPAPAAAPRSTSSTSSPASTASATTCPSCRCPTGRPSAGSSGPGSPCASSTRWTTQAAIDAVAAHLAAVKADVVHNHMYRAEVVGTQAAWRLADAARGPHRRGRADDRTSSGTVHSSRVRSDEDRELIRRLTPQMDHLIAVSRAIVRKIEDEGRDGAPVSLIYNGVDLTRYAEPDICGTLHEEFPIPLGAPIVGVVARLEPEKGHPTLIDAWPAVLAAVPNAHLLIVGEGSTREALEEQVAALGIGASVTFTGRRDDVPAVTAALDVAVLPSYREAQGLSILEAMALYRPVVASAVGGIPEMIEHGRTGLLVPPRDPAALAASIVRLLGRPPLRRHARARRTRPRPRPVLRGAHGPRRRVDLRRVHRRRASPRGWLTCRAGSAVAARYVVQRRRQVDLDRRERVQGQVRFRPGRPLGAPAFHVLPSRLGEREAALAAGEARPLDRTVRQDALDDPQRRAVLPGERAPHVPRGLDRVDGVDHHVEAIREVPIGQGPATT